MENKLFIERVDSTLRKIDKVRSKSDTMAGILSHMTGRIFQPVDFDYMDGNIYIWFTYDLPLEPIDVQMLQRIIPLCKFDGLCLRIPLPDFFI